MEKAEQFRVTCMIRQRLFENLSDEECAKLDHARQRSEENEEKLKVSMVSHLSTLNDGIIAIFITVMMLEIPYPSSSAEIGTFVWSILVFAASFFIIADFWYDSKGIFQSMSDADHLTVVADFVYLAVMALIPVTTKWIMNVQSRDASICFGIVYFLTVLAQEFLRFSALRRNFVHYRGLIVRLFSIRLARIWMLIAVLLVLSWFVPQFAAIAYIILPVFSFFMPAKKRNKIF